MSSYDYSQNSSISRPSNGFRKAVLYGGIVFLLLIGFLVYNTYVRYNQPLTIINGTGETASVQIDGGEVLELAPGITTRKVAEGSHVVRCLSPFECDHEINVSASFFGRTFNHPAYVVNLGGVGIVADMVVTYAERNPPPPKVKYRSDLAMTWDDVDFPFEELPDEIEVDSATGRASRTALRWIDLSGSTFAAFMMLEEVNPGLASNYAERMLRLNPDDDELLAYVTNTLDETNQERFKSLIESHLDDQPVRLNWHRVYQDMTVVRNDSDALLARYDGYLDKHPQSAEYLYLRGRCEPDPERAEAFYKKAIQADPKFDLVRLAIGYLKINQAKFEEANEQLALAVDNGIDETEVLPLVHQATIGLNQQDDLIPMYEAYMKENPAALLYGLQLAEVHVINRKPQQARNVLSDVFKAYSDIAGTHFQEPLQEAKALGAYMQGNKREAREFMRQLPLNSKSAFAWAEMDDLDLFAKNGQIGHDANQALVPLVAMLRADRPQKENWWRKGVEQVRDLGPQMAGVLEVMTSTKSADEKIAMVKTGLLTPQESAILLTALAERSSSVAEQKKLAKAAKLYTISRRPPFFLLRKTQIRLGAK